jgi:hypothetical protein
VKAANEQALLGQAIKGDELVNQVTGNCATVVKFRFTWRHIGWINYYFRAGRLDIHQSTDPDKEAWLNAMSRLTSSKPTVPPLVRIWLSEECRLVEVYRNDLS